MKNKRKRNSMDIVLWCLVFVTLAKSSCVVAGNTTHLRGYDKDREGHRILFNLYDFGDPQITTVKGHGTEDNDISVNTDESLERKKPIVHFLTYGGSHELYHYMARELAKEANATGWFETVTAYTEKDIPSWAATKYEEILRQPRGGYWIWRYPVLQKRASEIKDGEFILFMDSDVHFKTNDNSDLLKWTKMLRDVNQGILLFDHPYTEDHWTTEHIFRAFGIPPDDTMIRKSNQLQGSVQLLRKCQDLDDYFELIYFVLDKDPWMITDRYNEESKSMGFAGQNRHDQSISSIAQKLRGALIGECIWYMPTAPFCWPGSC